MKRAYILVYVLVIVSLLFMVVVKITDSSLDRQTIEISLKENLTSKYVYESAGHIAINEFKTRGWFDRKLYESTKKNGKFEDLYKFELGNIEEDEAKLVANRGYANISIGNEYSLYRLLISLRLYDDFYYTDNLVMDYGSDSYEKIINGPYLDTFEKDILSLDKKLITSSNGILYFSDKPEEEKEINQEEIKEAKPSGFYNQDKKLGPADNLLTEDPDPDKAYLDNYEPGQLGNKDPNNKNNETPSKDPNQEFENQDGPIQDPLTETELQSENESLMEESEEDNGKDKEDIVDKTEPEDGSKEPLQEQVDKDKFLIFGPENIYDLKDKTYTQGILYIGEETQIKSNIEHHGLAIITGRPKINKAKLVVMGGFVDKDGIYKTIDKLDFKPNKDALMKSLAFYKGFYDVHITSFTIK